MSRGESVEDNACVVKHVVFHCSLSKGLSRTWFVHARAKNLHVVHNRTRLSCNRYISKVQDELFTLSQPQLLLRSLATDTMRVSSYSPPKQPFINRSSAVLPPSVPPTHDKTARAAASSKVPVRPAMAFVISARRIAESSPSVWKMSFGQPSATVISVETATGV